MWVRISYNGKTPVTKWVSSKRLVTRMLQRAIDKKLDVVIDIIR